MRKTTRKLAAVLLSAVCTLTAALPAFSCCPAAAAPADTPCRDVSFTASEKLAALIAEIEAGVCNLYLSEEQEPAGPLSVGERLNNSLRYYAFTNSGEYTSGKQCYIYAQSVYGKLFDELPLHGPDPEEPYRHSEQAAGYVTVLTPEYLSDHAVMPGAYLRTTANYDGSYNGKSGHSMILLGYNRSTVHILEGNGDGYGLIRDVVLTYEQFNRVYLERKGRSVGQVIQPTAAYYLANYGLVFGEFPFDETDSDPSDGGWNDTETEPVPSEDGDLTEAETTAASAVTTAATTTTTTTTAASSTAAAAMPVRTLPDVSLEHFLAEAPAEVPEGNVLSWTSSDPGIAVVDENGVITPVSDGSAVITAEAEDGLWEVRVDVSLTPWAEFGDADGDGAVDAYDAQQVLVAFAMRMVGMDSGLDEAAVRRADIDGDGVLTAMDASSILLFFTEMKAAKMWDDAETGWRSQFQS